ncbi:hypothetical protein EDD15DRAFT_2200877 [Pisolithus albus]|nr:hypothetical protein EDD15DRAFT_2200877 [Pisolithus albus]
MSGLSNSFVHSWSSSSSFWEWSRIELQAYDVSLQALYVRRSPFHFKYMPLRMVPSTCELSKPTRTTAAVLQFVSDQTKLANLIATPSASLDRLLHELMKEDRANLEALQWANESPFGSRNKPKRKLKDKTTFRLRVPLRSYGTRISTRPMPQSASRRGDAMLESRSSRIYHCDIHVAVSSGNLTSLDLSGMSSRQERICLCWRDEIGIG